jgi:hypothetical protein
MSRTRDHANLDGGKELLLVSKNSTVYGTEGGLWVSGARTFEMGHVKASHFFFLLSFQALATMEPLKYYGNCLQSPPKIRLAPSAK